MKTDYIKVVKFGGSSLADAAQFKKVIQIIRDDESRRYVVPSAPGKRFSGDFKVTDKLYECYNAVVTEKNWMNVLNVIKERYAEIVDGLGIDFDLETPFDEIAKHIESGAGSDRSRQRPECAGQRSCVFPRSGQGQSPEQNRSGYQRARPGAVIHQKARS